MENQKAEELSYYAEDYQEAEELEGMEDDGDEESMEAFDDESRDDDESFGAEDDDEDIEAYEAAESDDEAAYEFEESDDEGMEYDDEALNEGYAEAGDDDEVFAAERSRRDRRTWAARQRALQLAKRRAHLMKMRALAAQRMAARNARKTQLMLNKKLSVIRGRGRVSVPRISKARGTGYVTAVLPNGRRTKMMFLPALATRTDVNHLTRQISAMGVKQARAIQMQAKNIKLLKSAQSSAVKSLTAQQLKSTKLLTKQITDGDKNLDKRITKLVSNQKKLGRRQDAKMLGRVHDQQRRATWNSVLIASAIPLFAAYGDRAVKDNANPLTKKNLIIAGSTMGWLFADDLIARYLTHGSKKWRGAGKIWNIVAPFANWATVYYFMKDRQHERFVTNVEKVDNDGGEHEFDFLKYIGEDSQSDFKKISNPRVIATIQSQDGGATATGVQARIDGEKLKLRLVGDTATTPAGSAMVSWQLDTMDPDNQRTSSSTT